MIRNYFHDSDWHIWIESDANGSPKTRGIPDLHQRISRLKNYETWGALEPLSLQDLAGAELWDQHWVNLEEIEAQMRSAQVHAEILRLAIRNALSE